MITLKRSSPVLSGKFKRSMASRCRSFLPEKPSKMSPARWIFPSFPFSARGTRALDSSNGEKRANLLSVFATWYFNRIFILFIRTFNVYETEFLLILNFLLSFFSSLFSRWTYFNYSRDTCTPQSGIFINRELLQWWSCSRELRRRWDSCEEMRRIDILPRSRNYSRVPALAVVGRETDEK